MGFKNRLSRAMLQYNAKYVLNATTTLHTYLKISAYCLGVITKFTIFNGIYILNECDMLIVIIKTRITFRFDL